MCTFYGMYYVGTTVLLSDIITMYLIVNGELLIPESVRMYWELTYHIPVFGWIRNSSLIFSTLLKRSQATVTWNVICIYVCISVYYRSFIGVYFLHKRTCNKTSHHKIKIYIATNVPHGNIILKIMKLTALHLIIRWLKWYIYSKTTSLFQ